MNSRPLYLRVCGFSGAGGAGFACAYYASFYVSVVAKNLIIIQEAPGEFFRMSAILAFPAVFGAASYAIARIAIKRGLMGARQYLAVLGAVLAVAAAMAAS